MYRILQAKLLLGSKIDRYVVKKANLKRQVQKGKKGGSCTLSCTSISIVYLFENSRQSPPVSSSSFPNCSEPPLKSHECLICKDSWDLKDDSVFGLYSSSSCIKYKLINKKGYIKNIKITTYQRNWNWVFIIHLFLLPLGLRPEALAPSVTGTGQRHWQPPNQYFFYGCGSKMKSSWRVWLGSTRTHSLTL